MNHKAGMLAAIRGEPTDCIPWAPRLDLWYKANARAGTLPEEHRNSSLVEIVDELGMGLHAVVPDFRDLRGVEDDVDRGLGIYNLKSMPYRTVLENVARSVRVEGDRTFVEYATPAGPVRTTDWPCSRSASSQDSPMGVSGGSLLPYRSRRRPPQMRRLRIGSKTSG